MVVSRMSKRIAMFEHLGPYAQDGPVAALCELTERVWSTYLGMAGAYVHAGEDSCEYLVVRMLYIAEITSSAVRLNASWALTVAAMSLLRDRYEQVVRFSWLFRNPDPAEFQKYERSKLAKITSLVRNMSPETRSQYQELTGKPLPAWATDTPTKEERAQLEAWNKMDLRTMATGRDAFPPIADTVLAKQPVAGWYGSIYSQLSSVTHYDHYGIELLGLQKMADGSPVLATQPHWPGMLILQNAQFDLIQCFEAAHLCHKADAATTFDVLLAEWLALSKQLVPR
jgi:hypothetical protein